MSREAHGAILVVPLGSTEQHGPHLPLDTDTVIATAVAERLVERFRASGDDAVLAPAIAFAASGEHAAFAGTVSIGAEALAVVLIELARSASAWAGRIIIVNAHGGNVPTLRRIMPTLEDESRRVTWVACEPPPASAPAVVGERAGRVASDLHAGRTETSLMLHLAPARVRLDAAEAGVTAPLGELLPAMLRGGVAMVSPNGVIGDPRGASADEGRMLFEAMVDEVHERARADIPVATELPA
ncbi:mycofactocin biosynthesis peptidyl-dipeptidase MftE [Pseudoclavibacter endophyticus]|uniref:Mycofactocin biosynthesis peptidyl-dipeptidase MftE n=1 Tax=Pseudoclavibacter endophyticus TaxID=1778590 RepID=A0A6H9WUI9_9MICO|nr:mycofactocin biosynthesis peptidyl-dipeptidase MftE [Pseudoclavibacter endophyticus]